MESWGASTGEALHTQTFLGNPVGCAMALACMEVVDTENLVQRAAEEGALFAERLGRFGQVRGRGWMLGLEIQDAPRLSRDLLERGWIVLPAGEQAEVLAIIPPLNIAPAVMDGFLDVLETLV